MKHVCIAIVDAANARIYSYQGDPPVFREIVDLLNPGRRGTMARPTGRNLGAPRDHRDAYVDETEREFAKQIVTELSELVRARAFGHVILVASPRLLGELRKAAEPLRRAGVNVDELERDLVGLTSPQIHDRLASLKLIDPRARAR